MRGKEASSQPARATDERINNYTDAPSVEVVGAAGQRDGDAEAHDPGRDGEELGVDGFVAQAGDNGGREEGEGALRDDVSDVGDLVQ